MKRICGIVLVLCLAMTAAGVLADDAVVETARKLYKTHQESVVYVTAVVRIEGTAGPRTLRPQEQKIEVLGTVIDPSGLTVLPNSGIDPSMTYAGRRVQGARLVVKASYSEVKIRLSDGTEIPAKIVLKDTDLDLAFVMPDAGSEEAEAAEFEFKPVDLKAAARVNVLDEVISLGRLGKALDRRPTVALGRIAGVVKKPRNFYVATTVALGGPVFTADGKIVGITVRRIVNGRAGRTVIMPAADAQETAEQALTKVKDDKKDDQQPVPGKNDAETQPGKDATDNGEGDRKDEPSDKTTEPTTQPSDANDK